MTAPRRILLVDADAFFVAVARMVDPEGAGRARLLIVGGSPGSRGVVCSASYEARQFGVRSAMPIARAVRLCPRAMCVPVPRGACSRKSREIGGILSRYTPLVQPASIDEWYLDLSGTEALYHGATLTEIAHRIRATVHETTGLSVSLGGGSNKLVAKLAVEFAKPKPGTDADGVQVVEPGDEVAFMRRVALADIPGVGPRFRDKLESLRLRTVSEVLDVDLRSLERMLGESAARWLHDRARGVDTGVVEPRERPKSVSHEDTFDRDIESDDELERELVRLVTRTASDLRARSLSARTVSIKLRDTDFRTRRASRSLEVSVVSDRVILETARELLARLRSARRVPVRLLGVALTGLSDADAETQLSLFDQARAPQATETPKDRALASAVDALRERFGSDAIFPGRLVRRGSPPRRGRPRA